MARYPEEHKEAVLSKLLPPYSMALAELARQEGIFDAAPLYLAQQSQVRSTTGTDSQPIVLNYCIAEVLDYSVRRLTSRRKASITLSNV